MKHSKKGSRGPRLYFSHFQNRILCAFLLCTLIPIFIIGGISYAVSYNIAKDKILNASISADAQLHTQFDNRLQQVENIADTLQYNMYNLMQADAPMDKSSPNLCVNSSFSYVVLSTLLLSSGDLTEWSLVYHNTLSYQRFYDLHSIHYDHLEGLHQLI